LPPTSSPPPDGGARLTDRQSAQSRLDRIGAFTAELHALEQGGIITLDAEQRRRLTEYHGGLSAALTARFDVDVNAGQRQMTIGMRIASLIGAIALCAAIVLFFYRIWGWLATAQQVAILIAAPAVGVVATEIADRYDRSRHFVFIAGIIACGGIVLNVAMVGTIFAMTDSPNALAVWGVFALIVGYGYGVRIAVAAGLALVGSCFVGVVFAARGFDWTAAFQRPEAFLPLGLAAFLIGAAIDRAWNRRFAPTYRIVGLVLLLVALWALSVEAAFSALTWTDTRVKAVYQVLGFLAAAMAIVVGVRRRWDETTSIGAAMFVIFLYTKFYQWFWDWMPAYLFFLIVGLVAVGAIVVLQRLRRR
jgi:hypothetical protein